MKFDSPNNGNFHNIKLHSPPIADLCVSLSLYRLVIHSACSVTRMSLQPKSDAPVDTRKAASDWFSKKLNRLSSSMHTTTTTTTTTTTATHSTAAAAAAAVPPRSITDAPMIDPIGTSVGVVLESQAYSEVMHGKAPVFIARSAALIGDVQWEFEQPVPTHTAQAPYSRSPRVFVLRVRRMDTRALYRIQYTKSYSFNNKTVTVDSKSYPWPAGAAYNQSDLTDKLVPRHKLPTIAFPGEPEVDLEELDEAIDREDADSEFANITADSFAGGAASSSSSAAAAASADEIAASKIPWQSRAPNTSKFKSDEYEGRTLTGKPKRILYSGTPAENKSVIDQEIQSAEKTHIRGDGAFHLTQRQTTLMSTREYARFYCFNHRTEQQVRQDSRDNVDETAPYILFDGADILEFASSDQMLQYWVLKYRPKSGQVSSTIQNDTNERLLLSGEFAEVKAGRDGTKLNTKRKVVTDQEKEKTKRAAKKSRASQASAASSSSAAAAVAAAAEVAEGEKEEGLDEEEAKERQKDQDFIEYDSEDEQIDPNADDMDDDEEAEEMNDDRNDISISLDDVKEETESDLGRAGEAKVDALQEEIRRKIDPDRIPIQPYFESLEVGTPEQRKNWEADIRRRLKSEDFISDPRMYIEWLKKQSAVTKNTIPAKVLEMIVDDKLPMDDDAMEQMETEIRHRVKSATVDPKTLRRIMPSEESLDAYERESKTNALMKQQQEQRKQQNKRTVAEMAAAAALGEPSSDVASASIASSSSSSSASAASAAAEASPAAAASQSTATADVKGGNSGLDENGMLSSEATDEQQRAYFQKEAESQQKKEEKKAAQAEKNKRRSAIEEYGVDAVEAEMQKRLRAEIYEEIMGYLTCIVCTEPMDGPYLMSCGHMICYRCREPIIETRKQCPYNCKPTNEKPYRCFQLQALVNHLTGKDLTFESQEQHQRKQLRTFSQHDDDLKMISDLVDAWRRSARDIPAFTDIHGKKMDGALKEWCQKHKPHDCKVFISAGHLCVCRRTATSASAADATTQLSRSNSAASSSASAAPGKRWVPVPVPKPFIFNPPPSSKSSKSKKKNKSAAATASAAAAVASAAAAADSEK